MESRALALLPAPLCLRNGRAVAVGENHSVIMKTASCSLALATLTFWAGCSSPPSPSLVVSGGLSASGDVLYTNIVTVPRQGTQALSRQVLSVSKRGTNVWSCRVYRLRLPVPRQFRPVVAPNEDTTDPGLGRICIVRPSVTGQLVNFYLHDDLGEVGVTGAKNFLCWDHPVGKAIVWSTDPYPVWGRPIFPDTPRLEIPVMPQKTYFVIQHMPKGDLELASSVKGRKLVSKSRLGKYMEDEYFGVTIGMSLEDVVARLGIEGEEAAELIDRTLDPEPILIILDEGRAHWRWVDHLGGPRPKKAIAIRNGRVTELGDDIAAMITRQ